MLPQRVYNDRNFYFSHCPGDQLMKKLLFLIVLIGMFGLTSCDDAVILNNNAPIDDEGQIQDDDDDDDDGDDDAREGKSSAKGKASKTGDEDEDDDDADKSDKTKPEGTEKSPDDTKAGDDKTKEDTPPKDETAGREEAPSCPDCAEDEKCVDGQCLPRCIDETTYCNGDCLFLDNLHLKDCNTCADNYCDADANLANGCEINAMDTDNNNCGACGKVCETGTSCKAGVCESNCEEGKTWCGESCLNLSELHLASCSACADNYCDADGNLANGCEIDAKGSDANNCGACGKACNSGEVCNKGTCAVPYESHRMMVVGTGSELMVRKGPGTTYEDFGELYDFQYITVLEEKDGWYRHNFNGQDGWSSGDYLMDACDNCKSRKAIDYAEKFLYDPSTRLCTWDHLTHEPIIQNFTDLWANYQYYNHGYNDNCANFVTACLKSTGLISISSGNYINVGQIDNHCDKGTDGYRRISFEQAKPGDIWVNTSHGHTELVLGYKNGVVYLIGSNNFSSGDSSKVCQINTGAGVGSYQRVSYSSSSKGSTGYICSRQ